VTVVVVFLRASIMGKLKIILAGFLFMLMVTATMPGKLVARYKSVTDDEVDTTEMDTAMATSAIGSTESRKVLLRHSILFTIQHPIFGLGAGNFPLADDTYSKTLGMRKGNWLGTHNSYTQVSSELGIPALLFFVAAIGFSLKVPYSLYKKTRGDPRLAQMGTLALSLHYCLVIYAVTVLFEHIAYTVMLPVFGGMCASLARTAAVEVERIQATPLPVTMAPDLFHTYLARRPAADAMAGRNAGAPVSGPE
jgi:O-antigen ligase